MIYLAPILAPGREPPANQQAPPSTKAAPGQLGAHQARALCRMSQRASRQLCTEGGRWRWCHTAPVCSSSSSGTPRMYSTLLHLCTHHQQPLILPCAQKVRKRRRWAGRQLASVIGLAARTGAADGHTPDEHLSQVASELAVNVLLRARQLQVHVGVHGHKVACTRHALNETERSEPHRCTHQHTQPGKRTT